MKIHPQTMIYCDNAATSFPKPDQVIDAVVSYMKEIGANPGRSGHGLTLKANRIVNECRSSLCRLFNIAFPERVVFTSNVTEAINLALYGLLRNGDHVVTTSVEHNSVMRPLRHLEEIGRIQLSITPCSSKGVLDTEALERNIRQDTRLIAINHASNVMGTILPIEKIGAIKGEALLLVDAAQTAGIIPIDVEKQRVDLLAFTGHKALYGPMGTGGLYVGKEIDIDPLIRGGTGTQSELEQQPPELPDRLESGTANAPGIAGLGAGVEFVLEKGMDRIRKHENQLIQRLIEGLKNIEGIVLYGPCDHKMQTANLSLNLKGVHPAEVARVLEAEFEIMVRAGLHCSPSAHKILGTYPDGTVRLSLGYFNTLKEVDEIIRALEMIIQLIGHSKG